MLADLDRGILLALAELGQLLLLPKEIDLGISL